jgi:hypothetical protein
MKVEIVTLTQDDHGTWEVEARVSGLSLDDALRLQQSILFLSSATVPVVAPEPASFVAPVEEPVKRGRKAKAPEAPAQDMRQTPIPGTETAVKVVEHPKSVFMHPTSEPPRTPSTEVAPEPASFVAPVEPPKVEPPKAVTERPLVTHDTDTELAIRLADAPNLRAVLEAMGAAGIKGTADLTATALRLKDRVPVLSRIADIPVRVARAAEVLGVA